MHLHSSHDLFLRAQKVISGGVNSPSRSFAAVGGGPPVFVASGQGPYLYDEDGNRYIDYLCAYGAMILGHAPESVVSAVTAALPKGSVYGTPTRLDVEFAELLCSLLPGIDRIRFNVSGTEAVMTAIRLARAATGRSRILKFDGSYHGHSDLVLVAAGSGSSTLGIDDSLGLPESIKSEVISIPFNNPDALCQAVATYGDTIAAALIEPVVGNFGIVPPEPGFLELIQTQLHKCGALVIWDEVITAFRFAYGSVQQLFGLQPDIITLGKVIGGGLPIGAYGARSELMEFVAPLGGMYQDGTFASNPLSMAAGLACVKELAQPGLYQRLTDYADLLVEAVQSAAKRHGIPVHVGQFAGSLSVQFTDERVIDFDGCERSDSQLYARFFRLMLDQGIFLAPSKYEAWFVSAAHTKEDIDETISAVENAFAKM